MIIDNTLATSTSQSVTQEMDFDTTTTVTVYAIAAMCANYKEIGELYDACVIEEGMTQDEFLDAVSQYYNVNYGEDFVSIVTKNGRVCLKGECPDGCDATIIRSF